MISKSYRFLQRLKRFPRTALRNVFDEKFHPQVVFCSLNEKRDQNQRRNWSSWRINANGPNTKTNFKIKGIEVGGLSGGNVARTRNKRDLVRESKANLFSFMPSEIAFISLYFTEIFLLLAFRIAFLAVSVLQQC